jgi:chromosome segregation ATPase
MTLQPVVGILSGIAALLFFGTGYLMTRFKEESMKHQTVEQLKQELKQVIEDRDATHQALASCQTERKQEREQIKKLQTTIEGLEKKEFQANFSCQTLTETLEDQGKELERIRKENQLLKETNDSLRSQFHSPDLKHQPLPQIVFPEKFEDISSVLEIILKHLSQNGTTCCAVLADEQGLPVAGSSEHSEVLAVIAAMFDDLVKRLPTILPVNTIQQFNVIDKEGKILAAQYFQVASSPLILVSLSDGETPDWTTVNELFNKVSTIIEKTE